MVTAVRSIKAKGYKHPAEVVKKSTDRGTDVKPTTVGIGDEEENSRW